MYRIGEFSKIVKLTVKTLRFYEEVGLLSPAEIDEFTGYRSYSNTQLFSVQQIVALREAGFSIEEIKRVLSGTDVVDLLDRKERELTLDKTKAEERLKRLTSIKKFYSEESTMNYQAVLKKLPSYTVYYKRFLVRDFSDYGTAIPAIGAEIAAANPTLKCAEPDFCYVEYLDGEYREHDFNVEYAEAVEQAGVETDTIKFKVLSAAEAVCVMHKGGYTGLGKAYAYLTQWVEENGYEPVGNYRERYIDGCWNQTDEENYLTEVQVVVRKKG